jgi:hypothetical protein
MTATQILDSRFRGNDLITLKGYGGKLTLWFVIPDLMLLCEVSLPAFAVRPSQPGALLRRSRLATKHESGIQYYIAAPAV